MRGIDLELFKGEFLTIFGPNGAGKTTLIKILSSLAKPTSGTAYVAGFNIEDADPQMRSQIGVISHASYLYDNLSALENLVFYAKMHRLDNPEERAAQVIDEMGLKARMHDPVGVFSPLLIRISTVIRLDPWDSVVMKDSLKEMLVGGGESLTSSNMFGG